MNYSSKQQSILNGNLYKVIFVLAVPIMFNNLIQTLYSLVDTYWVSKIGDVQVAAITFDWPVIYLLISIGAGINIACTALISQYTGADNIKESNRVAGQSFSFTLIFSVILSIVGIILAPMVVRLMGADGALYDNSVSFLRIMYLDIPSTFVMYIFASIRQSQGDTVSPMKLSVAAIILNILLDPVFIFIFKMGITGAALATVLSKLLFTSIGVYWLFTRKEGVYIKKENLKWQKHILIKIVNIGLPSSVGQACEALGFIVLNVFIVSYGDNTLAAFGIGNRINSIIMMPALGIGTALTAVIGLNIGANQTNRARKAFRTSLYLSIIILAAGGAILYPFSKNIVGVFTTNQDVLKQGTEYLKLITVTVPLMGIFQVCMGTFQGSGHTLYSMALAMVRLWAIRLPMILILKNFTSVGSSAVWYSMIVSNMIICIIGLLIYLSGKWERQIIKKALVIK